MVKNPSAMQETQVWSLGWEDPLEKEMATHSSILAWRNPQTEEPSLYYIFGGMAEFLYQFGKFLIVWCVQVLSISTYLENYICYCNSNLGM